jgi:hypothetical protein
MDDVQVQAALMTQPEGFYCGDCTARLAAAPSFAAWVDAEWEDGLAAFQAAATEPSPRRDQ